MSRFGFDFDTAVNEDSEIIKPLLLPGIGKPPDSDIVHGWSANKKLIMRGRTNPLTMQADFPDPGNYTFQFGINPKTVQVIKGQRTIAEAFIQWSVEGNFVTRRVTVGNGVSVTGMGQAARVTMSDVSLLTGGPFPAGFDPAYDVSVQVVKGVRPSVQQPPQLIPQDPAGFWENGHISVPAATLSPPLIIPVDAGVISMEVAIHSVLFAVIPDGAVVVRQQTLGDLIKEYDPRNFDWCPVSAAAEFIQIFNSTAGSVFVNVTWGIDG